MTFDVHICLTLELMEQRATPVVSLYRTVTNGSMALGYEVGVN